MKHLDIFLCVFVARRLLFFGFELKVLFPRSYLLTDSTKCLALSLLATLGSGDRGGVLLLGDEHRVDVGQNTAGSDGHTAEELVELLVVADGQLDVAGDDAGLLVVAGGVAGELEDLSAEVLEDRGEVHGGTGADAGGVLALLEEAAHASHGELQAGLGRLGGGLAAGLAAAALALAAALSFARHVDDVEDRIVPELRMDFFLIFLYST